MSLHRNKLNVQDQCPNLNKTLRKGEMLPPVCFKHVAEKLQTDFTGVQQQISIFYKGRNILLYCI